MSVSPSASQTDNQIPRLSTTLPIIATALTESFGSGLQNQLEPQQATPERIQQEEQGEEDVQQKEEEEKMDESLRGENERELVQTRHIIKKKTSNKSHGTTPGRTLNQKGKGSAKGFKSVITAIPLGTNIERDQTLAPLTAFERKYQNLIPNYESNLSTPFSSSLGGGGRGELGQFNAITANRTIGRGGGVADTVDYNQLSDREIVATPNMMNIELEDEQHPQGTNITPNLIAELKFEGKKLSKYKMEGDQGNAHKKINDEFPQFMLGERGQEQAFKKGIIWLKGGELPLLRDYQTASEIFNTLKAQLENLGSNNCFINLSFCLLEMIQASKDPFLWGDFTQVLKGMRNPDLLEYVKYLFSREDDKSFHISRIQNLTYDTLPKSGRIPSYLTLFRLENCKRQLAECILQFFQKMISYRYWSDSMSYKDGEIFDDKPHDERRAEGGEGERKTSILNLCNQVPKLSEKIQEEKRQQGRGRVGEGRFDERAPSRFMSLRSGPLNPEVEKDFWFNHYVFLSREDEEQEEEIQIEAGDEEPQESNRGQEQRQGTDKEEEEDQSQNREPTVEENIETVRRQDAPSAQSQDPFGSNIDLTRATGTLLENEEGEGEEVTNDNLPESLFFFESRASNEIPYQILDIPPEMVNPKQTAQGLHVWNLLQEFCDQQSALTEVAPHLAAHTTNQPDERLSYFSLCAALGQIRLTQGLNQLQYIHPESGKITFQNKSTSDSFDLGNVHIEQYSDVAAAAATTQHKTKRGVILKNMSVELIMTADSKTDTKYAEPPLLANVSYHLVDRMLQPYILLDLQTNNISQLLTSPSPSTGGGRRTGVTADGETIFSFPAGQSEENLAAAEAATKSNPKSNHNNNNTSNPSNTLFSTIDLIKRIEKSDATVAASHVDQFFKHDGFLFCQPSLNLKNLQIDQSWRLNFKWQCLEGSQNLLSCIILASYLHSIVYKSYSLHFSNLRRDNDAGIPLAKQLLKNLKILNQK